MFFVGTQAATSQHLGTTHQATLTTVTLLWGNFGVHKHRPPNPCFGIDDAELVACGPELLNLVLESWALHAWCHRLTRAMQEMETRSGGRRRQTQCEPEYCGAGYAKGCSSLIRHHHVESDCIAHLLAECCVEACSSLRPSRRNSASK